MKKSDKAIKLRLVVFAAATALVMLFIYWQSLQPRAASDEISSPITLFLKFIFDPADCIELEIFHIFVRKVAHFVEYGALGVSVGGFAVNLGLLCQHRYVVFPVLMPLFVAASDEYLQSLVGRNGTVSDVILDYSGALFGLATTAFVTYLLVRRQRRNKNEA